MYDDAVLTSQSTADVDVLVNSHQVLTSPSTALLMVTSQLTVNVDITVNII